MTLRRLASLWVLLAFAAGLALGWLWLSARLDWQAHLARAQMVGTALYDGLAHGTPAPEGLTVTPLDAGDTGLAQTGDFARLSFAPQPAFVTVLSIRGAATAGLTVPPNARPDGPGVPSPLGLAILSPRLMYPVARLPGGGQPSGAARLGEVVSMVARLCSDATLVAHDAGGRWYRIEGAPVWSCAAAPADPRLALSLAIAAAMIALLAWINGVAARFADFADELRDRGWLGGPTQYRVEGPAELRDIADQVNAQLAAERAQLARRAEQLSGISHDLGTPTTRLRLRAALIPDPNLRARFEADLDEMTGMIGEVLTYSRAEIETEQPRTLSLAALIEAVVADYQDTGQPVVYGPVQPITIGESGSVFRVAEGGAPRRVLAEERRVLVTARPMALRRATTNLIDNALKYGRRASLWIEADSRQATICVQDAGAELPPETLADLGARYARGANADQQPGMGLGLAIVATIADQHGGGVTFERNGRGTLARLTIRRGTTAEAR